MTTVITRQGDNLTIESANLITVYKHNDVGVSIDYYIKGSEKLYRSETVWFDDLDAAEYEK